MPSVMSLTSLEELMNDSNSSSLILWPPLTDLPDVLDVNKMHLEAKDDKASIPGLNPKKVYLDRTTGKQYILKQEKIRSFPGILSASALVIHESQEEGASPRLDHRFRLFKPKKDSIGFDRAVQYALLQELNFRAAAVSIIAPILASHIFGEKLRVPENKLILIPVNEGEESVVVLSSMISKEEAFNEFLSKKALIVEKKPKSTKDWDQTNLLKRDQLHLTLEEAHILGQIYFVLLWFNHLDGISNIDLTNSGVVVDATTGELKPCIVDWGNCLGIGFGGVSLDATAFNNPAFPFLHELQETEEIIIQYKKLNTGFLGVIPFTEHVYAYLPRQICPDLFDMTTRDLNDKTKLDSIAQAMFDGFKMMFEVALRQTRKTSYALEDCIQQSMEEALPCHAMRTSLDQELFGKKGVGLAEILMGRLNSLGKMITNIDKGMSLEEIQTEQFKEFFETQSKYRSIFR